jgi:hypothetical protein
MSSCRPASIAPVPVIATLAVIAAAAGPARADDRTPRGLTASVDVGVAATVGGVDDRALAAGTGPGLDVAAGAFVSERVAVLFHVATSTATHNERGVSSQVFAGPAVQLWRGHAFASAGVGLAAAQRRTVDMFDERQLGLGLDLAAGAAVAQWRGAWTVSVHLQAGVYGGGTATSLGLMLGYQGS